MPHALLLSPDNQAVNAITGVLDEMSVTCERPLDGASAAQKLNSHSFDLVLVDCENLPAAKLIFDVCRRGNSGANPVPIAIVDGRAGLPTAFRLGAELILTKPVSQEQARSTIRAAVSRVRKDGPANASVPVPPNSAEAASTVQSEEREQATAAAALSSQVSSPLSALMSAQMTSFAEPTPSSVPTSAASAGSATLTATAPPPSAEMRSEVVENDVDIKPASPKLTRPSAFFATSRSSELSPASAASAKSPANNSANSPVESPANSPQASVRRTSEAKPELSQSAKGTPRQPTAETIAPAVPSDQQNSRQKRLLATSLILALAVGALYAAWMYQPGFRAIAQPQVDRIMVLLGIALPPALDNSPAKPMKAATPATKLPVVSGSRVPTATSTSGQPAGPSPAVTLPLSAATNASAPAVAKPEVNQPSTIEIDTAATLSANQLPGESSAIILSSKGAEKRLAQSVAPKFPVDARIGEAEGTVVLKEVVDETGKVEGVRLVEGNATLATAAMNAVKQWRYRPYIRDGKAQPFQTVVIIDFQRP